MADIDGYLDIIRTATSGESVRDAIIQCMNDINQDSALELSKLVITGKLSQVNHSWKPGKGKAYSMVSLQVSPDEGGDAPSTNTLTYEEFTVNNDTTAGRHAAPEGTVYNAVNVDIDFTQYEEGIADNITISVDDLEADHTYSASKMGYNAMKKVTLTGAAIDKAIAEKGGTIGPDGATYYPCTFYNDTAKQNKMETVSVREGDDASSYITKSPSPIPAGKVLNGWSPSTSNVKSKTEFIPKWASASGVQPGEIGDTWEQIFAAGSATYPIGSWKNVDFNSKTIGPFTYTSSVVHPGEGGYSTHTIPKLVVNAKSLPFMQVAQGERGTVSTWVSMEPLYFVATRADNSNPYYEPVPYYNVSAYGNDYWDTSYGKQFCNTFVYQLMDTTVSKHIVDVGKTTRGAKNLAVTSTTISADENSLSAHTTNSKIWVPSYGEISGFFTEENRVFDTHGSSIKDPNVWVKEPDNIDYYTNCPEFAAIIDQLSAADNIAFFVVRTQTAVLPRNAGPRIASTCALQGNTSDPTVHHHYSWGLDELPFFQAGTCKVHIGFCLNA